jgi:hypothetical protein
LLSNGNRIGTALIAEAIETTHMPEPVKEPEHMPEPVKEPEHMPEPVKEPEQKRQGRKKKNSAEA